MTVNFKSVIAIKEPSYFMSSRMPFWKSDFEIVSKLNKKGYFESWVIKKNMWKFYGPVYALS